MFCTGSTYYHCSLLSPYLQTFCISACTHCHHHRTPACCHCRTGQVLPFIPAITPAMHLKISLPPHCRCFYRFSFWFWDSHLRWAGDCSRIYYYCHHYPTSTCISIPCHHPFLRAFYYYHFCHHVLPFWTFLHTYLPPHTLPLLLDSPTTTYYLLPVPRFWFLIPTYLPYCSCTHLPFLYRRFTILLH